MITPKPTTTITAVAIIAATATGCGVLGSRGGPEPISRAHYSPFGAEYRGVSFSKTRQQFDIQTTETEFGLEYFLRADVADSGGTLRITLVLDSILLVDGATGGLGREQADSARGAEYRAILASSGQMLGFGGGDSAGKIAEELAARVLEQFFPRIPTIGAEPGDHWADTVETELAFEGVDNTVHLVNEHEAVGWTIYAGVRALHVETTSRYTLSGSGVQLGREFTLEGSGRSHSARYIGEDGRYLGSVSADTADFEALLTSSGDVVPIHQIRVDTLSIRW